MAEPVKPLSADMREFLGKLVRAEWMRWAVEQPDPKPSWLAPWESLTEPMREVDRRIGEAVFKFSAAHHAFAPDSKPRISAAECRAENACRAEVLRLNGGKSDA